MEPVEQLLSRNGLPADKIASQYTTMTFQIYIITEDGEQETLECASATDC